MVNRGYSTSRGREFKSQCRVLDIIFINDVFGGSPGLVVNKVDSTSRGREFKSWHHTNAFWHYYVAKVVPGLKRKKMNARYYSYLQTKE